MFLTLFFANSVAAQERSSVYKMVRDGIAASRNGECEYGLDVLAYSVEQEKFVRLPRVMQNSAVKHLLRCSDEMNDWSAGLPYLIEWIEATGESDFLLFKLLVAGVDQSDGGVLVDALERIYRRNPDYIDNFHSRMIRDGMTVLSEDATDAGLLFRFLQTMHVADYQPYDTLRDQDYLAVAFARVLVDHGQPELLEDVILGINNPSSLIEVRIDKRFDAIRGDRSVDEHLNIEVAAERYVTQTLELVGRNPLRLEAYVIHLQALMAAWKFEEALEFIEEVVNEIDDGTAEDVYSDYIHEANWLLNGYAVLLRHLGRADDSDKAFDQSSTVTREEGRNVSQTINYARDLLARRRYQKALSLVSGITIVDASTYGMMWARSTEVCAISMLDEAGDYTAAISYLIFNATSNTEAMVKAYLCIGDMDNAAKIVIKSLQDPAEQITVLLNFQNARVDTSADKADENSAIGEMEELFRSLADREDVSTAIEAVGRIEDIWLHSSAW